MNAPRSPLRNVPLFWKVLLPFLALMVLVGASGVFLVVRDLSETAKATLDQDLARRSLDARSLLRDRELYLLESANFAANVEGMARAIDAGDTAATARLLQSVLALKGDLTLVAATNRAGSGLVEFNRATPNSAPSSSAGSPWIDQTFVANALASHDGTKSSALVTVDGTAILVIAAPVCTTSEGCAAVGAAIVGIGVGDLATAAAGKPGSLRSDDASAPTGAAIYGIDGELLARSGLAPAGQRLSVASKSISSSRRQTSRIDNEDIATLYAPFEVQGERVGTIALSVPTAPAFSSVRSAGMRVAVIVLLAMAGIVALGALLSRSILAQVRTLVETSRALGRGDLTARAPVLGDDEHGELARRVNQMAEQLEASYTTLELRVDERTEEVRRLLQDRTEFFAGLSHELRTPLAIILTQAEMLSTEDDRSARDEATSTIKASAEELLEVVNDILDLARAEAGSIDVQLGPVSIEDLLRDLQPMLVRLGAASEIEVVMALADRLPPIRADRARLRDVIVNLVDNAIKYTPAGGRIEISAAAGADVVRVAVTDTGVGIPVDIGDRVFEPFYRVPGTRAQRNQPSTGLGLALTRRWVEAQAGTIEWTPNPSGGTTFAFTMPTMRRESGRTARRRARASSEEHSVSQPLALVHPGLPSSGRT